MEDQPNYEFNQVRSVVFKNSVEALLLSIEQKAEDEVAVFENILALSDLLGEVVERALDVVDNIQIKLYRSEHSSREVFEIPPSTGPFVYHLFPNLPFCSCQSFYKQVVKGDEYCCKHYIATRIARALGKVEVIEKSLFEFRAILKKIKF